MQPDRVYEIRRAILGIFKEYNGPLKFDDLFNHPSFVFIKPSRAEALEEWNALLANEFIQPLRGSGGEYLTLPAKGRNQINREGDLDPFIWGKHGLR